MTGERRALVLIVLVGLVLRVGWGLRQPGGEEGLKALPDQVEYLALGKNLLRQGRLVFFDERFGQDVFAYRTPGYPAFVAACGAVPRVVRVVQGIVDASAIVAVYLIARRVLGGGARRTSNIEHRTSNIELGGAAFGDHGGEGGAVNDAVRGWVALVAAGLVAVNPFLVYFSGLVLSETLFTALLVWGVAALAGAGGWRWGGPVLLALAAMVRPSGLLLTVVLPLVAGRGRWKMVAVGIVALVILFGGWAWRNHSILGRWVFTTTNEGITQYDGFHPGATGASDQSFVAEMPELREMGEVGRSLYLARLADEAMRERPGRILTLAVAKLGRTFSPVPLSDQFGKPAYKAIAAGYAVPVFLLAIVGVAVRWEGRGKGMLILPVLYFALVHAFSVGSLRYRVPVEPFVAVLASGGVWCLMRRIGGTFGGGGRKEGVV